MVAAWDTAIHNLYRGRNLDFRGFNVYCFLKCMSFGFVLAEACAQVPDFS